MTKALIISKCILSGYNAISITFIFLPLKWTLRKTFLWGESFIHCITSFAEHSIVVIIYNNYHSTTFIFLPLLIIYHCWLIKCVTPTFRQQVYCTWKKSAALLSWMFPLEESLTLLKLYYNSQHQVCK